MSGPRALQIRGLVEGLEAPDQVVPGTVRLVARAEVQGDAIGDLVVVLEEIRLIQISIVLVFARSMIERAQPAKQEIGERMPAACRAGRTSVLAVRDEVPGPSVIVVDLGPQVLQLEAELEAVPSLDPVRFVVELESVAWERRFEVVAEVEVALRPDLGNRWDARVVRKPDAEILRGRDLRMRPPRRVEAVVAERRLVEQRGAECSLPARDDALTARIRLETRPHVAEDVLGNEL